VRQGQVCGDKLDDRSREYALACKNRGIARASLGQWEDAIHYLDIVKETQEARRSQEVALSNESEERYHQDVFELYYHAGMVQGRLAIAQPTARGESEACFKKARDILKHLSSREAGLR
jgi:hypothetical protein